MEIMVRPELAIVTTPTGEVQVGVDPSHAVRIRPPRDVTAARLARWLRCRQSPAIEPDSIVDDALIPIGEELIRRGLASPVAEATALPVHLHGDGPIAASLSRHLGLSRIRLRRTGTRQSYYEMRARRAPTSELLVLCDAGAYSPRLLRALNSSGSPYLWVHMRDGIGIVGPYVVPGETSCPLCMDLYRTDRDEQWPAVSSQLRDHIPVASPAAVMATVGFALPLITEAVHGRPVSLLRGATVAVDVRTPALSCREWPRQSGCSCAAII